MYFSFCVLCVHSENSHPFSSRWTERKQKRTKQNNNQREYGKRINKWKWREKGHEYFDIPTSKVIPRTNNLRNITYTFIHFIKLDFNYLRSGPTKNHIGYENILLRQSLHKSKKSPPNRLCLLYSCMNFRCPIPRGTVCSKQI